MRYTKKQREFMAVKHNKGGVYEFISKHAEGVTVADICEGMSLKDTQVRCFIRYLKECNYIKQCELSITPVYMVVDTDKSMIYGLRKALKKNNYDLQKRKKKLLKVLADNGGFMNYESLLLATRQSKRELMSICAEGVKLGIITRSTDARGVDPLFKLNKVDQPKKVKDCSEIRHEMERYRKNAALRNVVNSAFGVAHA